MPRMAKVRQIGPSSRPHVLAKLDGRTREAALMRRVREELTLHVGGHPNAIQRALIERAVILSLRVAQIDAKIIAGEELSLHASNHAIAFNNSLRRTLVELGVEPAEAPQPTLADLFPDRNFHDRAQHP
jgi:hypothetical protein